MMNHGESEAEIRRISTLAQTDGQSDTLGSLTEPKNTEFDKFSKFHKYGIFGFNFTNVIVCRAMMPLYCHLENV